MREYGKIKWFGGYNSKTGSINNYGFISREGRNDLYVHRSQLLCEESLLHEGVVVTFEVRVNPNDGRERAEKVRLLESEDDLEVIEQCAKSEDTSLWLPVFHKYVAAARKAEAASTVIEKWQSVSRWKGSHSLYEAQRWFWSQIPDQLLEEMSVWAAAPDEVRVGHLVSRLIKEGPGNCEDTLSHIVDALAAMEPDVRATWFSKIPSWAKARESLFVLLPAVEQVEVTWQELVTDANHAWGRLCTEAKVLAIYRAAQENRPLTLPPTERDAAPLLQYVRVLFETKSFKEAHDLFQNHVAAIAWSSTEPLRFDPLLPKCVGHPSLGSESSCDVFYCEARPWPTEQDKKSGSAKASRAFCPRTRHECSTARLYADVSRDWKTWSLLELLEALGLSPWIPEMRGADEYVPKISGWVNRINEIRERLKCSVCGEVMKPRYDYAKRLARYNATVFSCTQGPGHDQNVYLNHCWACRKIIDSREDSIQKDGFYLCLHCGSGPRASSAYRVGDICPRCGAESMQPAGRRTRCVFCGCWHEPSTCTRCGHSIHKITTASPIRRREDNWIDAVLDDQEPF